MSLLFLIEEEIPVTLGPAASLPEMIEHGRFEEVHSDIQADRFPILPGTPTELVLHIAAIRSGEATTDQVLEWMTTNAFRPARIEELLAMASILRSGRLSMSAHALGSPWLDPEGLTHYTALSFRATRKLRCCSIKWEPWWLANRDCFPCVSC
jgi:hypothetical protein